MNPLSIILHSPVKSHLFWIGREICTDQNSPKTVLNKYVGGFWCERTTGDGLFSLEEAFLLIMVTSFLFWSHVDYLWIIVMFISTVRILLLTAPIHCRESIETHLDLRSNSDIKIKYRKVPWHCHMLTHIYIYIFSRHFYPKRLTIAFRLYIFNQHLCSLGIEPTTFCAANAMLYHWATHSTYSIQLIIISKIFQIEFRCLKSAIGVPFLDRLEVTLCFYACNWRMF